jgi:hypothetical protein
MQSMIIHTALFNEIANRIMTSHHSTLKKGIITLLAVVALLFYGIESFFRIFHKK